MKRGQEEMVNAQTCNNEGKIVSGTLVKCPCDTQIWLVGEVYEEKVKLYHNGKFVKYAPITSLEII